MDANNFIDIQPLLFYSCSVSVTRLYEKPPVDLYCWIERENVQMS